MWLLVALISSSVVVLGCLEIALRQFGPFLPGSYRTGPIIRPNAELGWSNVPDSTQWLRRPEYVTEVRVNRSGQHGPESPSASTAAQHIWLLGDSYVAAVNVAYAQSIAALLPKEVETAAKVPVGIVNHGVIGYGTDQQLLLFEREVGRARPDLAILVFTVANDVWNNDWGLESRSPTAPKPYFEIADDGTLRLHPLPVDDLVADDQLSALLHSSAVYSVLRSGLVEPFLSRGLRNEQLNVLDEPRGEWLRAWTITELLLGRIADASRRAGIPLLLVVNPDPCQVQEDACRGRAFLSASRIPQVRLREVARAAGLDILDLLPPFIEHVRATGVSPYYRQDLHWNAAGHALAARLIGERATEVLLR